MMRRTNHNKPSVHRGERVAIIRRLDPHLKDDAIVENDKPFAAGVITGRVGLRQSDGAAVRRGEYNLQIVSGGDACFDDAPRLRIINQKPTGIKKIIRDRHKGPRRMFQLRRRGRRDNRRAAAQQHNE